MRMPDLFRRFCRREKRWRRELFLGRESLRRRRRLGGLFSGRQFDRDVEGRVLVGKERGVGSRVWKRFWLSDCRVGRRERSLFLDNKRWPLVGLQLQLGGLFFRIRQGW